MHKMRCRITKKEGRGMRSLNTARKTIIVFSVINIVVIIYSVIMRIQIVNQKSELGIFSGIK